MPEKTPREVIAEADSHRRTANAAEHARTKIRLGARPTLKRGLLGFWTNNEDSTGPLAFDSDETYALYEALAIVRNNAEQRAKECETRLTVKETQ